jgi:hypothetical protein
MMIQPLHQLKEFQLPYRNLLLERPWHATGNPMEISATLKLRRGRSCGKQLLQHGKVTTQMVT